VQTKPTFNGWNVPSGRSVDGLGCHYYLIRSPCREVAGGSHERAQSCFRHARFFLDAFRASSPELQGPDTQLRDVLEPAVKDAEVAFASDPRSLAEVQLTLGQTLRSLSALDAANVAVDCRAVDDGAEKGQNLNWFVVKAYAIDLRRRIGFEAGIYFQLDLDEAEKVLRKSLWGEVSRG
jgi:hypothetical protein